MSRLSTDDLPRRLLPPRCRRHALALGLVAAWLAGCAPGGGRSAPGGAGEAAAAAEGQAGDALRPVAGVELDPPPAAAGAMAPSLATAADGSILLSWIEPEGDGHRLRLARRDDRAASGDGWSPPVTVAAGDDFFANWADVPSVVAAGGGDLWAHWLAALGTGTYAYGARIARSRDGGATWEPLGLLHDDRSPTEHGFVTLVPLAEGGVEAVWLDGRATAGGGAMTLRSRRLGAAGDAGDAFPRGSGRAASSTVARGAEAVIDERVCDCCSTAAVPTAAGLLVAYRDRSGDEVRDISLAHRRAGGWSPPRPLHRDGWTIPGCPVNGPALAASGSEVAAAWFTAAGGTPRVLAARSHDAGTTWSEPVEIDGGSPLGRVGLALAADGAAFVSWLAADGGVRLRRLAADGSVGPPAVVAVTAATRASGVPRLVAAGDRLHVAWVEAADDRPRRLRFATLPVPAR